MTDLPTRKHGAFFAGSAEEVSEQSALHKAITQDTAIIRGMLLNPEDWSIRDQHCQMRFQYDELSAENARELVIQTLRYIGIDDVGIRTSGVQAFAVTIPAASYETIAAYAAAHQKPAAEPVHHTSRVRRGPVQVFTSSEEAKLYDRAVNPKAWAMHNDTAYLNIPIPPMKPVENDAGLLQARTLHAELFLQRNAQWLEKHFGVQHVQGIIDHEDGGSIQLRVDAEQYREKIEPLAKETRGASR